MELELKGARAFVTAGASGIGLEIVKTLAAAGATVRFCDIDEQAMSAASDAVPAASAALCDVSDRGQVETVLTAAAEELGGLDILVNNAGIAGPTAPIDVAEPAEWEHCISVNLIGQFNCCRTAIPFLKHSKSPSIVNMSSAAGKMGFALRTGYAASKWGVIGLTKSLAIELGEYGIRVNAILPGLVAGARQTAVLGAKAEELGVPVSDIEQRALQFVSLRQYVSAQDIADQILFLASRHGAKISGQAISVCGDMNMLA